MSLLREIQNDLASANGDVATVLRKCKILAARLGSEEFARWVDWELNGYPESQEAPGYRKLSASCYAGFMNLGWRTDRQPVVWAVLPRETRESYQSEVFRSGVAKAKELLADGARIDRTELAIALQGKMYPKMNCFGAWQEISSGEFEQLFSAIKNRILDFVLEIEAENPKAGEAAINSQPIAPEKLQPLVNNFFASVGNLAQHSHDFNQTASIGIEPRDLSKLVAELTDHLDELRLDAHQKQKAQAQIATLKAQLQTDDPDPVIVMQAGRTLRNITEGAIASLLATAAQPTVWHTIHGLLAMFAHK